MSSPQIRSLQWFCLVADERSFSKAAALAGVTQSAVSQSISHLEESLNTKLIDRSKRPLALTDPGRVYLRGVRPIVNQYYELEERMLSRSQSLSGTVHVGAVYSVGLSYMPEATRAFEQVHPAVKVKTEFGSSQKVVEMVLDNKVDFGLVSFPKQTKAIGCIHWQNEPMRLVCSDQHPLAGETEISPSQLAGMEMIGFDRGLVLRDAIDACLKKAGIKVQIQMEFDNADSMVRAIQFHRGIGIVPEAVVRRETANGSLRVVACRELQMVRPLGIIYRKKNPLSPAAIGFGSLLLGREMAPDIQGGTTDRSLNRDQQEARQRSVSVIA